MSAEVERLLEQEEPQAKDMDFGLPLPPLTVVSVLKAVQAREADDQEPMRKLTAEHGVDYIVGAIGYLRTAGFLERGILGFVSHITPAGEEYLRRHPESVQEEEEPQASDIDYGKPVGPLGFIGKWHREIREVLARVQIHDVRISYFHTAAAYSHPVFLVQFGDTESGEEDTRGFQALRDYYAGRYLVNFDPAHGVFIHADQAPDESVQEQDEPSFKDIDYGKPEPIEPSKWKHAWQIRAHTALLQAVVDRQVHIGEEAIELFVNDQFEIAQDLFVSGDILLDFEGMGVEEVDAAIHNYLSIEFSIRDFKKLARSFIDDITSGEYDRFGLGVPDESVEAAVDKLLEQEEPSPKDIDYGVAPSAPSDIEVLKAVRSRDRGDKRPMASLAQAFWSHQANTSVLDNILWRLKAADLLFYDDAADMYRLTAVGREYLRQELDEQDEPQFKDADFGEPLSTDLSKWPRDWHKRALRVLLRKAHGRVSNLTDEIATAFLVVEYDAATRALRSAGSTSPELNHIHSHLEDVFTDEDFEEHAEEFLDAYTSGEFMGEQDEPSPADIDYGKEPELVELGKWEFVWQKRAAAALLQAAGDDARLLSDETIEFFVDQQFEMANELFYAGEILQDFEGEGEEITDAIHGYLDDEFEIEDFREDAEEYAGDLHLEPDNEFMGEQEEPSSADIDYGEPERLGAFFALSDYHPTEQDHSLAADFMRTQRAGGTWVNGVFRQYHNMRDALYAFGASVREIVLTPEFLVALLEDHQHEMSEAQELAVYQLLREKVLRRQQETAQTVEQEEEPSFADADFGEPPSDTENLKSFRQRYRTHVVEEFGPDDVEVARVDSEEFVEFLRQVFQIPGFTRDPERTQFIVLDEMGNIVADLAPSGAQGEEFWEPVDSVEDLYLDALAAVEDEQT